MNLGGWIFIILSWGIILVLSIFCFRRVFKKGLGEEEGKVIREPKATKEPKESKEKEEKAEKW